MDNSSDKTGLIDELGNEVKFGDTIQHVGGHKITVTPENLKEVLDLTEKMPGETDTDRIEGWKIVKEE